MADPAGDFGWVDSYKLVHPQKKAFLHSYASGHTISSACDLAGIARQTHYDWLKFGHDELESYRSAFADAKERRFEVLEAEARRRAITGIESTIVDKQGRIVGTKIEYSDSLLMFLMKAAHPEFREHFKANEDSGYTGSTADNLEKLTDEQLTQLKGLLGLMSGSVQST